tara:strand:- start:1607 stop:2272 length:666 start_codon:yes stop_codon:yes gene_type:complete
MYVIDEYTGQIKVDEGNFYVEAYRKNKEFQEIDLSRSVAVTDCVRKALRVMGVRDEVESVFSQRADLSERWLSTYLELGDDEKPNPFEVWCKVDFTFFPDSNNPNVSERVKEELPIFGEVILENLIEATHLREVDIPTIGLEIARRLVDRDLLISTMEGEDLLVVTGYDDEGHPIFGEREAKRICSLGFESIEIHKETLLDGEEVTVEHRVFYSWTEVVGD